MFTLLILVFVFLIWLEVRGMRRDIQELDK